jgi:hypothetical protein
MWSHRTLSLIVLLQTGCAIHSPYVALPLRPENCGMPEQFKPCGVAHVSTLGKPRPTVTIEVLTGGSDQQAHSSSIGLHSPQ